MSFLRSAPKSPALIERVEGIQRDAIAPSTALVPVQTLDALAASIRDAHSEAIHGLRAGAAAAIRAGKGLIAAKDQLKRQCGHGHWEDYVALECRLSMRTAQTYMNLARRERELDQLLDAKAQGTAFLTQAQALKVLGSSAVKKKRRKQNKTP